MDCLRFAQLVQRDLDRDLGPNHHRLMRAHAAACSACGALRRAYAALFAALADEPRHPAPADLEAAVMARVDVRAFVPSWRERALGLLAHPEEVLPSPAPMAVAFAAILAVVYAAQHSGARLVSPLLRALGQAGTWTYAWARGIAAEMGQWFAVESWPMAWQTLAALARAVRLLAAAHGFELALLGLAAVTLVAWSARHRLHRSRGGRHAHVALV